MQPAFDLSPYVLSIFFFSPSNMYIMNFIIATIKEPNAKEPQWYRQARLKLFAIGWSSVPFSWVKYQIHAEEA